MGTDLDWGIVARIVHVLAIVFWIGGVWFVTAIALPAMAEEPPRQWLEKFNAVERRFAPQARVAILLVLLSGLYMLYRYDLWSRFADIGYWWMHLMVAVWLLFAMLIFVLEPFVIHPIIERRAATSPQAMRKLMLRLHAFMLVMSLIAIAAAVGAVHGLFT